MHDILGIIFAFDLGRHDMHLIHHVIVVTICAARDNFDGIGSVICLACRLHHSRKCPTAKNSTAQRLLQRLSPQTAYDAVLDIACAVMQSAALAACHEGHAHNSPFLPPTRVVQGIPAKKPTPLHMIPVGQQDFCVCPVGQEVTPVLTGLLAVAPQLLASALIIHHLKAIHL